MVRLASVRILLALAVQESHYIHQMDVKTAFLNGDLEEDIYMEQPEGGEDLEHPEYVCHLKKALYGLKQAPRTWYKKMDSVLQSLGVHREKADNGIFSGKIRNEVVRIALCVDDLIISCSDAKVLMDVKKSLASHFSMKDLGELKHFLGIEINYDRAKGTLLLSQEKAIEDVLEKFNMRECKPISTPMEHSIRLKESEQNEEELENVPYRSAVGSLMYIMLATRPDIAYSVGVLSRFAENPNKLHWNAVKRVLRYLKGTKRMALQYLRVPNPKIIGYSDADWASDADRKSISGYAFFIGTCLVTWRSRKQSTVALSTAESETIALTEAAKEAQWLRKLMSIPPEVEIDDILIYADNQASIALSNREGNHGRTKHFEVRYLYMQDLIERKMLKLEYCPTSEMTADVLTKALPRMKHWKCCRLLGLSGARD